MRVSVLVRKKGSKREKAIGPIRLRDGKTRSFAVRRKLRPGDRIVLRRAAQKSAAIPRLSVSATATRKLGAR